MRGIARQQNERTRHLQGIAGDSNQDLINAAPGRRIARGIRATDGAGTWKGSIICKRGTAADWHVAMATIPPPLYIVAPPSLKVGRQVGHHLGFGPLLRYLGIAESVYTPHTACAFCVCVCVCARAVRVVCSSRPRSPLLPPTCSGNCTYCAYQRQVRMARPRFSPLLFPLCSSLSCLSSHDLDVFSQCV